jgi:hypothetical protein
MVTLARGVTVAVTLVTVPALVIVVVIVVLLVGAVLMLVESAHGSRLREFE